MSVREEMREVVLAISSDTAIDALSDAEAEAVFARLVHGREMSCPHCASPEAYIYRCRRLRRCRSCRRHYSASTQSAFAYRKLPVKTYLRAAALVVSAREGVSGLAVARAMGVSSRTGLTILRRLQAALLPEVAA